MNMYDFLDELFELYPNSWKESNKNLKRRQYYKVLDNPKVDFRKLLELIAKEYYSDYMPVPAWLGERLCRCYKSENETSWRHVRIFNPIYNCVRNTDCFPINTTDEQILATYKKMFPNTQGWRIEG